MTSPPEASAEKARCATCDDFGVLDGLEPCPEECAAFDEFVAGMAPGPCVKCGRTPAAGFASVWTAEHGEQWYCHGDDDDPSCYETTPSPLADALDALLPPGQQQKT